MFGLGNSLYEENYNVVGKNIDKWLNQLGAERYAPLGLGDENVSASLQGSIEADFDHWCEGFLHLIKNKEGVKKSGCSKGNNCCSKKKKNIDTAAVNEEGFNVDSSESDCEEPAVVDLEDLGRMVRVESKPNGKDSEEEEEEEKIQNDGEPREMLTAQLREALSKQGYRLIGSHSGVKLCRWTKVCYNKQSKTTRIHSFFCSIVYVERTRWLLQAFLLWYRKPSLYGDNAKSSLCK